jgi:uncharacterized protein YegJ (DUF2314 family)
MNTSLRSVFFATDYTDDTDIFSAKKSAMTEAIALLKLIFMKDRLPIVSICVNLCNPWQKGERSEHLWLTSAYQISSYQHPYSLQPFYWSCLQ